MVLACYSRVGVSRSRRGGSLDTNYDHLLSLEQRVCAVGKGVKGD